jgi:type II secretory pathway pseudopilin PulG
MIHKLNPLNQDGFLLPALLTFMIAMGIITGAVLEVVLNNFTVVGNNIKSQQAFNIAEAGLNYYLWHLSHNPTDFKDGKSTPTTPDPTLGYGPYVHNYVDSDAVTEGTYTLYIKPQGSGSTIATVRSIGKATNGSVTRTVQAQIGAPSFASYGVLSDSAIWFGNTESADGPVHSNAGVEMDGSSDAQVSSANTTYVPPNGVHSSNYANGASHAGVWCDTTVTSPVNCSTRNKSNWVYPVTSVDFNQVSSSLCTMKKVAFGDYSATSALVGQANACTQVPTTRTNAYVPQYSSTSFSISKGYLIKLNNNNTYDLYKVNSEDDTKTPYTSALGTTLVASAIPFPTSGVIFVEDNVWVLSNPTVAGRVTIASGRLASSSNSTNIVIAGDIKYTTKNGNDAVGLVAEDSIYIAPYAPASTGSFSFEVDGALLAASGNVMYGEGGLNTSENTYRTNDTSCTRGWVNSNQTMLFYGSVANRQTWTWTWDNGTGACGDSARAATGHYISGIYNNTTQYDYNLQYAPPPSYPVTSGYNILSWREVLTKP